MWRFETDIAHPQIEDLLDAGAGIEQKREQGVVALSARRGSVDALHAPWRSSAVASE
ncbi:MAG: hypothetical protein OXQ89_04675 [Rhodospirillaceae bacterium]|nr:hypothetical protein [Rhodospirillaceae bacterium]